MYGDAAATQRTAKDFKVYYEKRKTGSSYSVDHSGQSYVIDPQGRLRLFVRHDRIASDLRARSENPARRLGGRGERLAHLLERLGLDLPDALGRDLELGGELVQRRRRPSPAAIAPR